MSKPETTRITGYRKPDRSKTTDINLHAKLVETIAPMLTRTSGLGVGLVGRATMRRAEAIADAVLARIIDEGCVIVLEKMR